jgi:hypothetical protein
MSDIEAVGDALTGALLGRAIDSPSARALADEDGSTTDCLNCGARSPLDPRASQRVLCNKGVAYGRI